MKRAKSRRELARELGKSEACVRKWMKDDRWPFGTEGPWDVNKVRGWAERTLTPDYAAGARADRRAAKKGRGGEKTAPLPAAKAAPQREELGAATGGEDPTEERRVNIQLKRERAAMLRHQREVEEGKYLRREEVERVWAAVCHEVKTELLNLPDAVTPSLQGLDEAQQREVLRGRLTEALRHLARGVQAAAAAG